MGNSYTQQEERRPARFKENARGSRFVVFVDEVSMGSEMACSL